jgi:hypothetical protein
MVRESERVVAEWQDVHVGDALLDGPPGTACYIVREIDPGRSLVLFSETHLPFILPASLRRRVSGILSSAYQLTPLPGCRTRMVRRMRMACHPLAFTLLAVSLVFLWGEWITARRFLRGVKRRAERGRVS